MIKFKEILFLKNLKRVGKVTIYKNYWNILNDASDFDKLVSKISLESRFTKDDIDKAVQEAEKVYDYVLNNTEINVITVFDDEYPNELMNLENKRPLILYIKGNLEAIKKPRIAFIGTRKPSKIGMSFEKELIENILDKFDTVIVSGLALGCDKIAHQTTVDKNKITIAVLPSGVDLISPSSNKNLAQEIIDNGGCLISEYEPHKKANKGTYVERDSIVAAFSDVTFVVECGIKSGTMHTVKAASEYNKSIFTYLPKDRPKDSFDGNKYIFETFSSAILIASIEEFFEIYDSLDMKTLPISSSTQSTLDNLI